MRLLWNIWGKKAGILGSNGQVELCTRGRIRAMGYLLEPGDISPGRSLHSNGAVISRINALFGYRYRIDLALLDHGAAPVEVWYLFGFWLLFDKKQPTVLW